MRTRNVDLTQGSIIGSIIQYSIPLILSAILQQLYNMADLLIVGRFAGEQDMAAIGATGAITTLIIAVFIGLSTGVSVLTAQYYSAKDSENLSKVVHTNYAIAIYGGLAITIITVILAPKFLLLMDTPPEILDKATAYMRAVFLGIVLIMIYNMGSGILRSAGDSQRPFNFLVISAVLNIILDLLFVAVLKMGALGAGIATAIAQSVAGILITISLMKTTDIYHLNLGDIAWHRDTLKQIFAIGLPAGIQTFLISVSNVIIQKKINYFGAAAIAGVAASGRIDGFIFTILTAMSVSATTFSGQNIGAKKYRRLKDGTKTILYLVSGMLIVVSAIVYLFRRQFMMLFNDDPMVIQYGQRMLQILVPGYVIFGICNVLGGIIRGTGKSIPTMIITLITMFGFRIAWVYFALPVYNSIDVIFVSYPISWTLNTILVVLYFKFGHWRPEISPIRKRDEDRLKEVSCHRKIKEEDLEDEKKR